jgi:hypothetical protein
MNKKDKLVPVYTAKGELEARVIKGLLDSCGIPSLLRSNAALSIHSFLMDGMGTVTVMVAAEQAKEAKKIVEAKADV